MKGGTGSRQNYKGVVEIHLDHAVQCLKAAGYDGGRTAEYEGPDEGQMGYEKCYHWLGANV